MKKIYFKALKLFHIGKNKEENPNQIRMPKSKKIKQKQLITLGLVLLFGLAGYMNYATYRESAIETAKIDAPKQQEVSNMTGAETKNDQYFEEIKLKKQKAKSEALAVLKEMAQSNDAMPDVKKKAQEEIIKTAQSIEKEANIENTLNLKGFDKVSVSISDNYVSVSVKSSGLLPTEVAKIRDAVITETSMTADKIKIIEVK